MIRSPVIASSKSGYIIPKKITTTDTINTGEQYQLSYSGTDNTSLDSLYIEFSADGAQWDSVYFNDFTDIITDFWNDTTDWTYDWTAPDSIVCSECNIRVTVYDTVGLSFSDINNFNHQALHLLFSRL